MSKFSIPSTALLALSLLGTSAPGHDEKKPEQPYAVYVYDVTGEPENKDDLEKTTEQVRKAFSDRKKWFRLAKDPLEAEIRVEVLRQGKIDQLRADVDRTESTMGAQSATVSRPGLLDLRRSYFIECRYTIPGKFESTLLITGGSTKSAAKDVPRRLRTICDASCR